ncbi:hypothetical protein [Shewanella livingstonensis]|uniref:Uncharacterized protein n=1 Tax=Shewanella livingstonensis TaxID=150120 RepID=A0A3G8M1M0_9GAMM|nr:hypothetical protein [Shewanella livingstonensis]AZG74890.1 hypothetical protein EGC82_20350 [Shewanella livingstonensis]
MFGSEKSNATEIGQLWQRLVPLEKSNEVLSSIISAQKEEIELLKEKTIQPSESQKNAQHAARSAAQHNGKIQRTKEDVENLHQEIQRTNIELTSLLEKVQSEVVSLDEKIGLYDDNFNHGENLLNEISKMHNELEERINATIKILDDNEDLEERINGAETQLEALNEIDSRAQGILKNITTNHAKIKELRDEIIGYETENEDGESQRIDGIKYQLESTYTDLENHISELNDHLQTIYTDSEVNYQSLLKNAENKTEESIKKHENQYSEVYKKIITLLPAALTTGLSAAYNEKINSESSELISHNKTFSNAIKSLVCISLIPFFADLYLFVGLEKDLVSVISETPKLVLSILPLYLPILWMAYSSNKKVKLSKRLIEEYTHKAVLSKTFEGLATQIEELGDSETSNELRVKLLFNLLHVNSENPGKLISDYQTTDHPLMDALEKSVKLGDAIEKLKNIPGFTKLTAKLERESQEILKDANNKASKAMAAVTDSLDKGDNEKTA